ncbi:transcriptional regulator, XRE family with shikimate kinase activity [Sulfitobacter marinus]|uniref:Shikimate kinase n=1 Tax=Sulfitobacter marinus TaxID=394264 RepID=A0A1I6VJP5_9RHOB|nr:helix-turn-helix transcriptional regulator [Sulfitobacter marinus]SFT13664.1 transcriptional regulator, XRE family with shikimate kinase activity [Sulfitobacter marinus]
MPDSLPPPTPGEELIKRIAVRVREARKSRGLPRRVLSELSGVSPRYLAQLEAGEGNISVILLQRVAGALDLKIDALLAENMPLDRDAERMAQVFSKASPDIQQQVRALLFAHSQTELRAGRICLIGLRGAGKSTLGKLAGEVLGLPFIELNKEIEAALDMPIAEVLALYGQEGYRELEAEALERVSATHDRMILAAAGGIVAEKTTYVRLLQRFHTIWLHTSPAEYMQRVRAQGDERPMEGNPAAMTQLKTLLDTRTPLYERADSQVNTSNRPVKASLKDLLRIIEKRRFLDVLDG